MGKTLNILIHTLYVPVLLVPFVAKQFQSLKIQLRIILCWK